MNDRHNQNTGQYWFPAKKKGIGWGLPSAWQGWLTLAAVTVVVIGGYLVLEHPAQDDIYAIVVVVATLLLLVICWLKGEPLQRKPPE